MSYALQEASAAEWAAFTAQHSTAHLLQQAPWGTLKSAFGWEPQRLIVLGAAGPLAGAQILWRQQWGMRIAYVPRGPVWANDPAVDALLLRGLQRLARQRQAVFLRLEPDALRTPAWDVRHTELLLQNFVPAESLQPAASIWLDLAPEPDALFAGFSKGHRADVRRAERNGVTVRIGQDATDLAAFYAMMEATATRASFGIHSLDYYRQAWEAFNGPDPAGTARLLLAEHAGAVVAAFMVFAAGTQAQYMYSGSTETGMKLGANHALQWAAIQWARACGCATYDFWGIPEAFLHLEHAAPADRERLEAAAQATGMAGVYRFKKGWGGQLVGYAPAYDWVRFKPAYWLWQRRRGAAS